MSIANRQSTFRGNLQSSIFSLQWPFSQSPSRRMAAGSNRTILKVASATARAATPPDSSKALTHADGAMAALACSIVTDSARGAVISGSEGRILLPRRFYACAGFELWRGEDLIERIHAPYIGHGLAHEAAETMRCRDAGLTESPLIPLAETVGVLGTLDQVRALIGVNYSMTPGVFAGN